MNGQMPGNPQFRNPAIQQQHPAHGQQQYPVHGQQQMPVNRPVANIGANPYQQQVRPINSQPIVQANPGQYNYVLNNSRPGSRAVTEWQLSGSQANSQPLRV